MASKHPIRSRRILTKTLIVLTSLLVLVLIIVSLMLAFLPSILSTDRVTRLITDQIENSLNHPVHIREIDWTWTKGLTISGINIPGHPDFSDPPLIDISRAHLEIRFLDLLKKRLNFTFLLENPEIHLVRDESGRLMLPEAFAGPEGPEEAEEEPEPEAPKKEFELPVDIKTDIHLAGIYASFNDRQADQRYIIENGDIHLIAPSVVEQPLHLKIAADMIVNGQKVPHSSINASMKNLFGPSRKIRFDRVSAEITANLPGTSVLLQGDMTDKGVESEISIDLETLDGVAAPILPGIFKDTDISGKINLKAKASQAGRDIIDFNANLSGEKLSAAGRIVNGNSLGPGDISVRAAGGMNLKEFDLTLDQAELKLLENSRLSLQGGIKNMKEPSPAIDLTVAPVHIDIKEIAGFAKDYIPQGILIGQSPDDRTGLSIEEIHFNGQIPAGQATAEIQNLILDASHLAYQTDTDPFMSVKLQNSRINIQSVKTALIDLMPKSAELNAAVHLGKMAYKAGDAGLSLDGFALEKINAVADHFKIEEHSPLGVSGEFSLSNTASMASFAFNHLLSLSGTRQRLDVNLAVARDGTANGALNRFSVQIPRIKLLDPSYGPFKTPAGLNLSISDLRLNDIEDMDLDINDLDARLDADGMIALNIHADAEQTGKKSFNANADADINISKILEALNLQDRLNIKGTGNAEFNIHVSGRRPNSEETAGLKALELTDSLGFLDQCRINLDLSNGAFTYQPDDPSRLAIGRISGDPLFSYKLSGKTASGSLTSRINISQISNIFTLRPEKPVSGELTLDLNHTGADRIDGSQQLHIQPGDIDQSVKISLDGFESAIAHKDLYEIFHRISGQVAANIRLNEGRALKKLSVPGMAAIDIDGAVSNFIEIQKLPEDTVAADVRLNVDDLSASMRDIFTLNGINGGIELSRTLKIEKSVSTGAGVSMVSWLSQQMLESNGAPSTTGPVPSSPLNSRINQMTVHSTPGHGLSLQSGKITAGGLPIDIGPSRISIGLSRGLPGIDFLNLDMLGGTFLGDLVITHKPAGYFIETRINFTGIDPGHIFPEAAAGIESGESEISGSLYANIPISKEMQNVLENSDIRVDFRKIGSRALERLLYALDPHESNEAIVSQRHMLRMGSPKRIRLEIKDGFLSLEGEVAVRSITIAIPPIKRLNIAQLPGIKTFEANLSVMESIINALDMATSANLSAEKIFNNN